MFENNQIKIYAHRGGRGLAPENTLWAYSAALKIGVDYVDMDINMTKDGVLIVYHNTALDPNTTREMTGKFITKAIPIRQLNYAQIQGHNVGAINPQTKYKSFFPSQFELPYSSIPTLEEVIDFVIKNAGEKVGFQIELKADPTDMIKDPEFYKRFVTTLHCVLKEKNIIDRTKVQSFLWPLLIDIKSYDTNIKTAYLSYDEKFKDLMVNIYGAKLHTDSIIEIIKAYHGDCWNPLETQVTENDIRKAHQYGLKVIPFSDVAVEQTDFNTKLILKLIQWRVDGFITDRPDMLRGILASHHYFVPTPISVTKDTLLRKSLTQP